MTAAPPRAALYIRVSTVEQAAEGYSLAAQLHDLRAYCERKQYAVVEVYTDEGISAKDIDHRPDFRRLLQDAQAERFDVVVVMRLTRLTRSIRDLRTCIHKRRSKTARCEIMTLASSEDVEIS